jgi:acetoacetyl-CoA synthetase
MPGAEWFPRARLNYAEHLLGAEEDRDRTAVVARSQTRPELRLTFGELRERVARARTGLARIGVEPGDRVVAYAPNIPETLVAFIATASLGAIWATCAPEFGARSVIDRFSQIQPKAMLAVGGYGFRDKYVDRRSEVAAVRAALPTLEHVIWIPYGRARLEEVTPQCRSTTRCTCSSPREPPACRRRSSMATVASSSSTTRTRVWGGTSSPAGG